MQSLQQLVSCAPGWRAPGWRAPGYPHYMLKESAEQCSSIPRAAELPLEDLVLLIEAIKGVASVFVTGAGGAFFAADQIAYLLRNIAASRALGIKADE